VYNGIPKAFPEDIRKPDSLYMIKTHVEELQTRINVTPLHATNDAKI